MFDVCTALRAIAHGEMEGQLNGEIVLERVDWYLEEGRRRGLQPSRPAAELAQEMIAACKMES